MKEVSINLPQSENNNDLSKYYFRNIRILDKVTKEKLY